MDSEAIAVALARMEDKQDVTLERLERLESKVDYTNGRVRGLELFKARALAVVAVAIFVTPIVLPFALSH